jgi:hypothetical protein
MSCGFYRTGSSVRHRLPQRLRTTRQLLGPQKELPAITGNSCLKVIQELAVSLLFFAAVLFTFSSRCKQLLHELRNYDLSSNASAEELAQARYAISANITLGQRLVESTDPCAEKAEDSGFAQLQLAMDR